MEFRGPLVALTHHQSGVGSALEPDPDQIPQARGQAGGVGIGEYAPILARLKPYLQPGGGARLRRVRGDGDLGPQSCRCLRQFLGCKCWAVHRAAVGTRQSSVQREDP